MRFIRRGIIVLFVASVVLWLAVRILIVQGKDTTSPVISSTLDTLEVSVSASPEEMLQGLTASDNVDGDLTDKIKVGTHSKFIHPGVCEVKYYVFDSSYNVGQYSRKVTYTDYESPRFTLSEPLVYEVGSAVTLLNRVSAVDVLDGDINEKIKIVSSTINRNEEGVYSVDLEVANDYADVSAITLPVHMVQYSDTSQERPAIVLSSYLIYVQAGGTLDPKAYLEEVFESEGQAGSLSRVTIENGVNLKEPGVYEVAYTYKSKSGVSNTTYLVVVVTE